MVNKKLHLAIIPATLLLISNMGFASAFVDSSATIYAHQDGAFGPYQTLESNLGRSTASTSVVNESTSTNTLWAAGQSRSGNEFCKASAKPGKTGYQSARDIAGGDYRVVLDPSGPLMTGCNGHGNHSSDEGK